MKYLALCLAVFSIVSMSATGCVKHKKNADTTTAPERGEAPAAVAEPSPTTEPGAFSGYNIQDESESCTEIAPGTICTQEFTEEDEFGANCRKAGYQAVQCSCHHWLCEVKIEEYRCGTIAGIECEEGKRCEIEDTTRTDAAGICVPETDD